MMRAIILGLGLLAQPLWADGLPALHSVTGVAMDDVLNIRAAPNAEALVVGTLAPDATAVEVIAQDGNWGLVNAGEGRGYVSLRYLARDGDAAWFALRDGLTCLGTEPFWSLRLDPATGSTAFATMEAPDPVISPAFTLWPGQDWAPTAAIGLPDGIAVLRGADCSDGMSDRAFGIAVDLFRDGGERLSGCCSLALP